MILIEETAVPEAALPMDQLRSHLRLGTGFSDDDIQDTVLETSLRAAIAAIEARTGKILITREFSLELTHWRHPDAHPLPVAPVSVLQSLTIRDSMEMESTINPDRYSLRSDMQRPALLANDASLPTIPRGGRAELRFLAGYGTGWVDLPADLGQAVLLLAAHYYEHRHDTAGDGDRIPFGVTALIERYRTVRLLGGGAS